MVSSTDKEILTKRQVEAIMYEPTRHTIELAVLLLEEVLKSVVGHDRNGMRDISLNITTYLAIKKFLSDYNTIEVPQEEYYIYDDPCDV